MKIFFPCSFYSIMNALTSGNFPNSVRCYSVSGIRLIFIGIPLVYFQLSAAAITGCEVPYADAVFFRYGQFCAVASHVCAQEKCYGIDRTFFDTGCTTPTVFRSPHVCMRFDCIPFDQVARTYFDTSPASDTFVILDPYAHISFLLLPDLCR